LRSGAVPARRCGQPSPSGRAHRHAPAAGRGRPPQAAARRAGLEVVEKLLTGLRAAIATGHHGRGSLLVHAAMHQGDGIWPPPPRSTSWPPTTPTPSPGWTPSPPRRPPATPPSAPARAATRRSRPAGGGHADPTPGGPGGWAAGEAGAGDPRSRGCWPCSPTLALAGRTVTELVVADGRQETWVYDRLGDLQQAGLIERAGQGRHWLAQGPKGGWGVGP
jgi:hypothetical protein